MFSATVAGSPAFCLFKRLARPILNDVVGLMLNKGRKQMNKLRTSFGRTASLFFVTSALALTAVTLFPLPDASGGSTTTTSTTTTTAALSTATTTSTTTTLAQPNATASTGLITAGPSRSVCLTPDIPSTAYGLSSVQAAVTAFDNLTHSNVTCLSAYLLNAATWTQWVHPWVSNSGEGYSSWVAEKPQSRELVLAMGLIPSGLQTGGNPLSWESACAAGKYDSYATQFGKNLVAAGLQNSVLRLGPEMNGSWEPYFIGTTTTEQHRWTQCFDKEVTALRRAPGEHFLIDWNPNACVGNYSYKNYYPGNAYVDIMGLDLYDVGCLSPYKSLTFSQLASETAGLNYFEAFAAKKGKPMSLPEWGLSAIPSGDDPGYINGIGATVARHDFAFESYFDGTGPNVKALLLSSSTPLSVAAFRNWFGTS